MVYIDLSSLNCFDPLGLSIQFIPKYVFPYIAFIVPCLLLSSLSTEFASSGTCLV